MDELDQLTGQLNLLQPPTRFELMARELLTKARTACENLANENGKLKEDLENERKQHSETRDKVARLENDVDVAGEEASGNQKHIFDANKEIKKLKNSLALAINDPKEILFYLGAKATVALRQFYRSKGYQDKVYTVAELVAIAVPEELLLQADETDPVIGLMDFELRRVGEGKFKITYR